MTGASVSPTAHYTGQVWARNGLSHPALSTAEGRLLYLALEPAMLVSRVVQGMTLERFLLARHREIDRRLAVAVDAGVTQVLEVAAGLSPRGWRFAQRHGERLTYVEADLPGMAERKRRALDAAGSLSAQHRVVDIDATAEDGPGSLAAVAAELDPAAGLAIVTEGLLAYLDDDALSSLWRRIAATLAGFDGGVYLADLHLRDELGVRGARLFVPLLSAFVRSRVRLHFGGEAEASAALRAAGFAEAALRRPPESDVVRVVEATA